MVEVRTGAIVKNSGFFCVGGARYKTAFFAFLGYTCDYHARRLQETVLPQTNGTDGKPRL